MGYIAGGQALVLLEVCAKKSGIPTFWPKLALRLRVRAEVRSVCRGYEAVAKQWGGLSRNKCLFGGALVHSNRQKIFADFLAALMAGLATGCPEKAGCH